MVKRVSQVVVDVPGELPDFEVGDAAAVKAWALGTATDEQQRRAFQFVVYQLSGIGRPSFHHGDDHATSYKEGRRSVGIHLAHLVTTPMIKLKPNSRGPNG